MKNLILIRHAKATQDLSFKDFDRNIIPKGINNSILVAEKSKYLVDSSYTIWSSSAIRTHETCKVFVKYWEFDPNQIILKDNLYTFDGNTLEKIIKMCPDTIENLVIFGHNNALTDFVNQFGSLYIDSIPTSGFVSIVFDTVNWQSINKGKTDKIIFPNHSV
ncbi:MAG: histidine phosphatase family protein [Flavobacterium sp.]|uniref:SixA phosphatase family protein n=1 Tax=Flavobacterium sp. TaxID=239 RepID=UPI0022C42E7F|nr:histidine phosphatase family protein [Flavobacterium sp.]MCZ8198504.1 histidine phosphatase family protein [Flavobacterium sp.]